MDENITFGQVVKDRRTALGLTQTELAARVGCAAITIRKIEAGDLRPSAQIAELLAIALNVPEAEQYAFVQLARTRHKPSPLPTPTPMPGEIGLEDLSGRAVKGFQLGEKIGSGGFGVVYRAVQPSVERDVAVKIILPRYANHPEFIRRFEAEAQIIAHLEHPHIVPLYDYWRQPSAAYLIMRLLRGGSLEDQLQQGPIPLEQVEQTTRQIGLALNAAHKHGVVHRDIKPANVLLDEEHNAYLADFGIAKNLEQDDGQSLTQGSALFGSPAYISPEQILSEPVKPQSDIYCLGILLYEMLTGHKPFPGPTPVAYIQQHLNDILPSVLTENPDLPLALDEVIRQATAKNPADRFPDIPAMLAAFQTALPQTGGVTTGDSLSSAISLSLEELAALENPYKGLRAFTEADADNFYGRNALIQELFTRLSDASDLARFLAVVGPSGGGKSSVVKAGLVPALRRGGLPGSENWFVVDFAPGAHPWEEVEAALLRVAVNPPESLLNQLQAGDCGLLRAINRILPDDGETELVLVVDQFEELFTLVEDEAVREQFLNSLVTAVLDERSRVRVIITLRADFYDRPLQYVDFGDLLRQRTVSVLPMTPDELELAISQPVEQIGVTLEPGLAATIIRDVGDQPGTLPLLQYALTELFERRDGRLMTLAAYNESGGVTGALTRRADEIYDGLDESDQEATRQLFLRLITLGEGIEDTRRRVLMTELQTLRVLENVVDEFGQYRLLSFDHDPTTREPTVEVAHEALLREWPRLRSWLTDSREDVRLQRLLAEAAAQWQNANQESSYLLRGSRLTTFEAWAETTTIALTENERGFLTTSVAARDQRHAEEEARRQRELETVQKLADEQSRRAEEQTLRAEEQVAASQNLRRRAVYLTAALVIAALLAGVALFASIRANNNADTAVANANAAATAEANAEDERALAQENEAAAIAAQAEAVTQANLAAAAEAVAEEERNLAAEQRDVALAAEAEANEARLAAEEQTRLTTSRELALASFTIIETDPELSILLALEALSVTHTQEAEEALHTAIPASRTRLVLGTPGSEQFGGLAITPDGRRVVTMDVHFNRDDVEGVTRVWNAVTGEELLTLESQNGGNGGLAVSADSQRVATVSRGNTVRIWDIETGAELLQVNIDINVDDGERAISVAFSPDGTLLATSGDNGLVQLWDVESGDEILSIEAHQGWIADMDFSPDSSRLITSGVGSAKIWDAATGQELLNISADIGNFGEDGVMIPVAFSPDGTLVAGGNSEGQLGVWDSVSGEEKLNQDAHAAGVWGLAFSPDGSQLVTAGPDGLAKLWDLASGDELLTLAGHDERIRRVEFMPDGTGIVTASYDGTARIWDVGLSHELMTIYQDGAVDLDISPDGARLAATSYYGPTWIWEAESGELLHTLAGTDGGSQLEFSPDGKLLATGSYGAGAMARIWDVETGQELMTLSGHEDGVNHLAFSPDGNYLATTGADNIVSIWDVSSGLLVTTIDSQIEENQHVTAIDFSPDGNRLAISGLRIIEIWEADGSELQSAFEKHDAIIRTVIFSPDGTRLASAHNDGVVKIWDVENNNEELLHINAHTGLADYLRFTSDGRNLVTAGLGTTIKYWDAFTGEHLLTLNGHTDGIFGLALSPDDKSVFSASTDFTLRQWVLDLDELIALGEARVTRALTTEECQQYLHVDTCPVNSN